MPPLAALSLLCWFAPPAFAEPPVWPPAEAPPAEPAGAPAVAVDPPTLNPWGAAPPPPEPERPSTDVSDDPAALAPGARRANPWAGGRSSGPRLRLVYTGARRGVGSGAYRFHLLSRLHEVSEEAPGGPVEPVLFNGALGQGPWLLHAADQRVQTAVALLESDAVDCDPAEPAWALRTSTDVLVVPGASRPAFLSALEAHLSPAFPVERRACHGSQGGAAWLVGPTGAGEPDWALSAWEFRKAVAGSWRAVGVDAPFVITGEPTQETARMFAAASRMLANDPTALYVDAGAFVDGASTVRDGALSLHRPLGYDMLQRLGPAALVPGETELVAGASAFLEEAADAGLPYLATNWEAADPSFELPQHRLVTVQTAQGPLRVAFVGILDPALQDWIPQLAREGVTITDPIDGVQPVVDALSASAEPPDAIVALTTASGETMAEVRRRLRGVDVMAGDPTFATLRVEQREARLRPLERDVKGAPLTVPLDGLAVLDLEFAQDRQLAVVRSAPELLWADAPSDPLVAAAITRTRAKVYPPHDVPLLPPAGEGPLDRWTPERWNQLVCEAVRLHTGAHTVMLRELPPPPSAPGPLTRLQVRDQLGVLDELQEVRVPGDWMLRVLDKAYGSAPVVCGATSAWPKPDGRSIDPLRTYRVVTTDRTTHGTQLGEVLDSLGRRGPLDPAPERALRLPSGGALPLPAAVVAGIDEAAATRAEQVEIADPVPVLLDQRPQAYPPLWLYRLTQASLRVDRFRGVDDETFSAVPETLATNPSSLTLAAAVDTALEHSGPDTLWDLRLRGTYSTLQTDADGADIRLAEAETTDDVRWSTSLAVPRWAVPAEAPLRFMPFTELLYDTEVTPTLDEDGADNPKQRDLSLTLGVSAPRSGALQTLRLGAFANRDLTRLDDKPTEYGGKLEFSTSTRFAGTFTWTTLGELQVWADTPDDDPSDLRFRAFGETRLGMPLSRWLAISTYAQGFALQGRVPTTDTVGSAWMLGASLDLAGVAELGRQGQ